MQRSFSINFDYRCPFGRVANQHVLDGLEAGAGWAVRFVPFSLGQTHVEPGEPDVWDEPASDSGLLALQVGISIRDGQPTSFAAVHRALFAARHREGRDLRDRATVADVVAGAGADPTAALAAVDAGDALRTIRAEHEHAVREHAVWGVPTFTSGGRAAFVRLMDDPTGPDDAITTVERVLDAIVGWPSLNELKHTTTDR